MLHSELPTNTYSSSYVSVSDECGRLGWVGEANFEIASSRACVRAQPAAIAKQLVWGALSGWYRGTCNLLAD